jgi:hypothetical protein
MFLDKVKIEFKRLVYKYLAGRSCWLRNFLFLLEFCSTKADHVDGYLAVVGWVVDTEGSGRVIRSSYRH